MELRLGKWEVPWWVMFTLVVCTSLNVYVAGSLGIVYLSPQKFYPDLNSSAVLGMHLQLLEAFLASLGIAFAVFGFIGYSAVQSAAAKRAAEVAREVAERAVKSEHATQRQGNQTPLPPDLSGFNPDNIKRDEEGLE